MLGRKSFLIILSKLVSAALFYVGVYFISRYLSRDVYGSILFTSFLIATFNSIADLGLSSAHQKRISEGKDISDCLSTFITGKLFLIGVTLVATVSSLFIWNQVLGETLQGSTSTILVLIFILYYVFVDLASIATATFDARQETAKTQSSFIMEPLIRTPLVILVALARPVNQDMAANYLALAYMIGGMAIFIVAMARLYREHIPLVKPTLFRSYITFTFPLVFLIIAYTLFTNLPTLFVGMFWGSGQVSLYALPLAILNLFAVVGTAVATLTFPEFSKLYGQGDLENMRSATRQAERYIVMITLPALLIIILFPFQATAILFGPDYDGAAIPFQILAIATLLLILTNVYSSHIGAANRPDLSAKLMILTLVVLIVLLLIFVPTSIAGFKLLGLGAIGAAIATMSAMAFNLATTRITVSRLTGAKASWRMALQIPAALIASAVLFSLNSFGIWPMAHWNDMVAYALISYGIFATILYAIRELTREDIVFFISVINPKEMKNYIFSELGGKNSSQ